MALPPVPQRWPARRDGNQYRHFIFLRRRDFHELPFQHPRYPLACIIDRALELLKARCGERREGWIFTAFSASGHLTTVGRKFREARREAGLPEKLVLYCGRHDYGTRVLPGTGNLAVVMRAMGHGSPSTAMKYQRSIPARIGLRPNSAQLAKKTNSSYTLSFSASFRALSAYPLLPSAPL